MRRERIFIAIIFLVAVLGLVTMIRSGKILGKSSDRISTTRYLNYSVGSFDDSGKKYRAICFLASWDEFCKKADASIYANQLSIPDDAVIYKADFDSEIDLKHKYAINIKHECVVIDRQGKVVKRSPPEQIINVIKTL